MREFALVDLPLFLLKSQETACLDTETCILSRANNYSSAFISNYFLSKNATVSLATGSLFAAVYIQVRKNGACANIIFLKPGTALGERPAALEETCKFLGQGGVRHVLAHTNEESQMQSELEKFGFCPYSHLRVWKLRNGGRTKINGNYQWQIAEENQKQEAQILLIPYLPAIHRVLLPHQLKRGQIFLLKTKMDLAGFAQIYKGDKGLFVWLFLNDKVVDIQDAIRQLQARISMDQQEVFIGLYGFQKNLYGAMDALGEVYPQDFVLLVKHLVRFQKTPVAELQFTSKESSKTEWSAPFTHIQNKHLCL